MSKSLILLTAAASIGVSHALTCVDYGGNPSAPLTTDVTIGKPADLKPCSTEITTEALFPVTPCIRTCAADATDCFNSYKKGASVSAGCGASGTKCVSGTTTDGTDLDQLCCATDNCNTDMKATQKSASTTLSVATLAAAAVGIVAALLM